MDLFRAYILFVVLAALFMAGRRSQGYHTAGTAEHGACRFADQPEAFQDHAAV